MASRLASLPPAAILAAAALSAAQAADPECEQRLKQVGAAYRIYTLVNQGKIPASLSTLYYSGFVGDLKTFNCPRTKVQVVARAEIEQKSGYVLSPRSSDAGPRPLIEDRSEANHGGTGIHVLYSDGSVRWRPARAAAPSSLASTAELKAAVGQNLYLGARLLPASPSGGIRVEEVQSGGFMAHWGVKPADELLDIAGTSLTRPAEVSSALAGIQPDATIPITLFREGKRVTLQAAVGSVPRWLAITGPPGSPFTSSVGKPASPIRKITLCSGIDSTGNPVEPTSRFAAGSEKLSAVIDYEPAMGAADILVEWRGERLVLARSLGVTGPGGRLAATLHALRGKPFEPGRYRLDVYVAGRLKAAAEFTIE
jgi:hypothetical protein